MTAKMDDLPVRPGTYALILRLREEAEIDVGRLGKFVFPAGFYVYVGSARGPGGIRARLGRHLRGVARPHWHIDHLRSAAQVYGFGYQVDNLETHSTALPPECGWSQALAALPDAGILAPGFGASDCRMGCQAHLIHFPTLDSILLPEKVYLTHASQIGGGKTQNHAESTSIST